MAAVCATFASRRLARSAPVTLSNLSRRTLVSTPSLKATESNSNSSLKDSLLSTNSSSSSPTSNAPSNPQPAQQQGVQRGSLGSGSIFSDADDWVPNISTKGRTPKRSSRTPNEGEVVEAPSLVERDIATLERSLNPLPNNRAKWMRKMVIRDIKRRGVLSKEEVIMRTERESLSKSHFFKTSIKKLGPLARQIVGKNIDEAILQMRFSPKKAAKDVRDFLEQAKNQAIVARGMGLGNSEQEQAEGEESQDQLPQDKAITIKLKDGKRHTITDPTSIYIANTWVGRGPYGVDYDYRARGQVNIMRPPYTSITVVLKEEKTRVREWQDREEKALKERREKLWVPLPDRSIHGQSQYYSW